MKTISILETFQELKSAFAKTDQGDFPHVNGDSRLRIEARWADLDKIKATLVTDSNVAYESTLCEVLVKAIELHGIKCELLR